MCGKTALVAALPSFGTLELSDCHQPDSLGRPHSSGTSEVFWVPALLNKSKGLRKLNVVQRAWGHPERGDHSPGVVGIHEHSSSERCDWTRKFSFCAFIYGGLFYQNISIFLSRARKMWFCFLASWILRNTQLTFSVWNSKASPCPPL